MGEGPSSATSSEGPSSEGHSGTMAEEVALFEIGHSYHRMEKGKKVNGNIHSGPSNLS